MPTDRLNILLVTPMAPSPPRFGAQARTHGLMSAIAKDHDVSAIVLHEDEKTPATSDAAMRAYCRDVTFVRNPNGATGLHRRLQQLRSWCSVRSYQRELFSVPAMQEAIDRELQCQAYDIVFVNFPHLAHYRLRLAPPGKPVPVIVVDSHDVNYYLARQISRSSAPFGQRLHAHLNWRKLAMEELEAYNRADGVCVCSNADQRRLAQDAPAARTVVIPNAADTERLQPRESYPRPDGSTVLYFGLMSTIPNVDGVLYFLKEIWPRVSAARPGTRFVVVGASPSPAVIAQSAPDVTILGPVDDLRPHLSAAAAIVVPLRLGSGTRLKILEAWAMARPVVSTSLGAEGLDALPGKQLLIADDPGAFADCLLRVLNDSALAEELGRAGRSLAIERYSWRGAAEALEAFFMKLIAARGPTMQQNGGLGKCVPH